MAKIFLNAGETFNLGVNSVAEFVGNSGAERVSVVSSNVIIADQNVERIDLPNASSSYQFSITGNSVKIYSGSTLVATYQAGGTNQVVAFSNGSAPLAITALNTATLGGAAIPTTQGSISVAVNAADTSSTATGVTAGQTFTLTTGSDVSGVMNGSAGNTSIEGNDTFNATNLTYNANDVINGGAGSADVLNVSLAGTQGGNATVVGIETINVTSNGVFAAAYDATNVVTSGITINATNSAAGGSFTFNGVGTGSTINASGVTGALSLTTTAATSQTVTLNANSASSQTVTLTGSGATDVATLTAAGTVALTVSGVETVNLSGNGVAATYTVTGTAGQTFNLTGTQSVTLSGAAATFAGDTVTDSTTAGTTTVKITSNTATSFDLSKVAADVIDLNLSDNAVSYSVKPGQAIKISDATTTEVPTFDINDNVSGNITTGAISIDLQGVLTTAKGIALNATTSDDYINALTITNSTSDNGAALLIAANAAVTVNGTKALTLEAASTAKSINAAGLSGVLTVNYDNTSDIATVTSGSGNDFFTNATAAIGTQVTINGGDGNDTFTMMTAAKAVIDGGAGLGDKLILDGTQDATSLVLSNMEIIQLTSTGAATFKASQLTGKTYVVAGDATADKIIVGGATGLIDSTIINLSSLILDTANVTSTEVTMNSVGYIANTIALGATLNITGTSVVDTITVSAMSGGASIDGGAGADVITGGAGADTIIGGEGADTLISGTGLDIINLTETTSAADVLKFAVAATTDIDTVTGFKSGTDIISLSIGTIAGAGSYTLSTTVGVDVSAAIAAGSFTTISVAKDAAATGTAGGDTTNAIFFASTTATSFATAIGTATITTDDTDAGTDTEMAVTEGVAATWYDSVNSQAVFGILLNNGSTGTDVINSADGFVEIARVGMLSTDYTLANIDASLAAY